jgi:zinc transport system ATP-binding protein
MKAVSIEGVWVYRNQHPALEDICLDLEEGDFLGLIGPNGGGKTTLIQVMLGLVKPSRGEVRILEREPEQARRYIGYLPQKTFFDRSFPVTALEVVLMGRFSKAGLFRPYSLPDREAALRALEAVGLKDRAGRMMGSLSGGEQQRVLVARSLVSEPKLLLLDEPTAGVDAAQQTEFYEMLSRLNGSGMTIILVSHDISAVSTYVNRIACLNQRLYYHGSRELAAEEIERAYGCPVDVIAHGTPHRVLREHER